MINDKAGKQYWDDIWCAGEISNVVDPHQPQLNNYINRRFHEYFCQAFSSVTTRSKKILEIGCARSAWLPYFAKEFGFKVYGIDYSNIGCRQARQVLFNAGIEGEVVCADFFSPPETMLEAFDVVISFGVAEHFEDTAGCINAFSRFLKPNGIMITIMPNVVGLIGLVQKLLNRPVFDTHSLLDRETLRKTHEVCGLEVLQCDYFVSLSFSVLNLNGIQIGTIEFLMKKIILTLLVYLSFMVWLIETKVGLFRQNRLLSPYINCRSRKTLPVMDEE